MRQFILYLIRWQMSTPIIALCTLALLNQLGTIATAITANLIGGALFYQVDKKIFKTKEGETVK